MTQRDDIAAIAKKEFEESANEEFNLKLVSLIKSRHPLISISTQEEGRFVDHITNFLLSANYIGYTWDCVNALKIISPVVADNNPRTNILEPIAILKNIITKIKDVKKSELKNKKGIVFILLDFYKYLGKGSDPKIERLLRELAEEHRGASIIITGPRYLSSESLDHVFESLTFPRPNSKEVKKALYGIINTSSVSERFPEIEEYVEKNEFHLIDAVRGLTLPEAKAAFMQTIAISEELGHDPLDLTLLVEAKRSALNKSSALEYVKPGITLDDVGGLGNLTDWIKDRSLAFTPEAKAFGIQTPKGVLLVGVPGGGKSLSAKGIAAELNQPLIRFDFGSVMGSLVGESESNVREAINLIETLAPCVAGESIVYDVDGNKYTINCLMENTELFSESSFYVNSFNEETMKIEKTRVNSITKKPRRKKLVSIITPNSVLRVTEDHKMMVMNDGNLKWVEASTIKENDFVVSPKKLKRNTVDFDLKKALDQNASDKEQDEKLNAVNITFPKEGMSKDALFYIAGMIDGGGFLESGNVLAFEGEDWYRAYNFSSAMSKCFGIEPEIIKDDYGVYTCYVYNDVIHKIVTHVTKNLIKYDDEYVSSYVAGFFESSANIQLGGNTKISFAVEIGEEMFRLCEALNCLGIVAPKKTSRSVFISSQLEILSLAKAIVDKIQDKTLRIILSNSVADCHRKNNHVGYVCLDDDSKEKIISHEDSYKLLESTSSNGCKLMIESDIIGVRVMSVSVEEKDWVYDLSCEGNHNFFANNLLCHNCVMWVDEVEKALSAAVGKGSGDSGTTKRVVSTFLTWLQEKTKPIFVVCTANNVDDIPPEFMRAGRFDEVFFIDLPDQEGIEEILKIMIRKAGYDINTIGKKNLTIEKMSKNNVFEGFSGAEIEKAVNEALFIAFKAGRKLELPDIVEAAGAFSPLSKLRKEDFAKMKEWAHGNARFANKSK